MKNKKGSILAKIAIFTAIFSAIIAVGVYLKKKAEDISEKLDFDGNLYYDDEDDDGYFDRTEPKAEQESPSPAESPEEIPNVDVSEYDEAIQDEDED